MRAAPCPADGHAAGRGDSGFFDDSGFPVGGGWDDVRVAGTSGDPGTYCSANCGTAVPVMRAVRTGRGVAQ